LYRIIRTYGDTSSRYEWKEITQEIEIENFYEKLFSQDKVFESQQPDISLPREFISLANKDLPNTSLYPLNYLKSRDIGIEDVIRWKIGYCTTGKYASRVVFPSFNEEGQLNYFVTRAYDDSWKKYLNPPAAKDIIFNHLYLDFNEDLIIVEGVFDAIVSGTNSVPLLGSTLTDRSKLFHEIVKNDTPVYLALDSDANKKADRLIRLFLKYDIEVYRVNIDPYKDIGEMTKAEFLARKQTAEVLDLNNYLLGRIKRI
jgi:hypothetical protein